MEGLLTSPPVATIVFLALAYGLYALGGKIAARGKEDPGKRQPYACGEELEPPQTRLAYHAFFRLALMFGVLHVATLVLSTLPQTTSSYRLATVYLVGIGISVFVLAKGETE
jgi:NADH:ubiquinone oxidoreductase subunit 3 (subunit A)